MKADDARRILAGLPDNDEPGDLPSSVLPELTVIDLPDGASFQVGTMRDGVLHLDWNGRLYREGDRILGEADHTWTRKYWYAPLGLEQYLDLIRRAVETRHRLSGDVELTDFDDDGAYVTLRFRIHTTETNLRPQSRDRIGRNGRAGRERDRKACRRDCRPPVGLGLR